MKKILLTLTGVTLSALPLSSFAFDASHAFANDLVVNAVAKAAETANYPFEFSEAPNGENWAENTKWYTLSLRGEFLKYVAGQEYISLVSTSDNKNKNFLWMFVKNPSGAIQIFNAAAGADKVLASVSPKGAANTGANTYPVMTNLNDLTEKKGAWDFSNTQANGQATTDGSFFLDLEGADETIKMNNRDHKLAYWTGGYDDGSKFRVSAVKGLPVLDVQYSDAPTQEGFAANTKWHVLTINNNFLYYDVKRNYITNVAQNPNNYGSYWAFVKKVAKNGTEEIEIYNAGAGHTKVLSSIPVVNDGQTYPYMAEKVISGSNENLVQSWDLSKGSENKLFLKLHGTDNCYLNRRADKLAFWNSTGATSDAGSTLRVTLYDDQDVTKAIADAKTSYSNAPVGCVGSFADEEARKAFLANLDKNSIVGYASALASLAESGVKFDADKYYRLKSKKYMTMVANGNGATAKGTDLNVKNAAQIWDFSVDGDGYKLGAQHRNLKAATTSTQVTTSEETDPNNGAAKYFLVPMSLTKFAIDAEGNNKYDQLHEDASNNIVGWEKVADASQWYLIPASSIEVTVSAAGYATANYPFAVQLPLDGGLKAYTGMLSNTKDVFVLKELPDGKVPANTPVILAGEARTYSLTILNKSEQVASVENNPLEGTYLSKNIPGEKTVYIVAKPENKPIGFYKLQEQANGSTAPDRLMGANKAFLPGDNVPAQTFGFAFSLDENNGGTTGIEDVHMDLSKEIFFDLQGRRVQNPTKGIFVTKSGKKVLFNE